MSSSKLIQRAALAAIVGGLLWALFPLGTLMVSIEGNQPGTLAYQASLAYYWLMLVLPSLLMLMGLVGLHALHRGAYGRLGNGGFFVSSVGLGLMFIGNAVDFSSLTFLNSENPVGHALLMIGFLILLPGSVLLGLGVRRAEVIPRSQLGGLLLIIAVPLSIPLAMVLGAISSGDFGFWFAMTVPYGIVWVTLGSALRSYEGKEFGQPARVT